MKKSNDERVTKDLIETLEDGRKGFAEAAEKLADSDRPDLAAKFTEFAAQRASFASEVRSIASAYGEDVEESGSVDAAIHRGWMSVKDAFAGSGPEGVLDAAEQGEDHAVSEYERALEDDISAELHSLVQRQLGEIKTAHDDVRSLQQANN